MVGSREKTPENPGRGAVAFSDLVIRQIGLVADHHDHDVRARQAPAPTPGEGGGPENGWHATGWGKVFIENQKTIEMEFNPEKINR